MTITTIERMNPIWARTVYKVGYPISTHALVALDDGRWFVYTQKEKSNIFPLSRRRLELIEAFTQPNLFCDIVEQVLHVET